MPSTRGDALGLRTPVAIIPIIIIPLLLATLLHHNYSPFSPTIPDTLPPVPDSETATPMDGITHRTLTLNGINLHVAESGPVDGPVILLVHGFPELWYCWRHQMIALASLGYHTVAPDLRGFGDSDAPADPASYTTFHVVGDLVALIDAVAGEEGRVLVVGHDWGAYMCWYLCLFRPDKVKALVNLSVPFNSRNPGRKPIPTLRAFLGDDYYVCRIQEPGVMEAEFAELGTERVVKEFLTYHTPAPLYFRKGLLFGHPPGTPITLPSWLSDEDVKYYSNKYERTGFTGGLNYYRNIERNWELSAAWTGDKIKVPVKFIVGDQDLTYNTGNARDYITKGGMKADVPFLQEVVVMEGVGHFINEERPHDITNHIADFFRKF